MSKLKVEIAKKTIGTKDYRARRLDNCHANIVRFALLGRTAKTATERKFCRDMIDMYVKRYNWYLR